MVVTALGMPTSKPVFKPGGMLAVKPVGMPEVMLTVKPVGMPVGMPGGMPVGMPVMISRAVVTPVAIWVATPQAVMMGAQGVWAETPLEMKAQAFSFPPVASTRV